jgi:ribonuclease HI
MQAGVGNAGYVIADAAGQEVCRKGIALGNGVTNNEAESQACLLALQRLAVLQDAGRPLLRGYPVRVLGDSQLVIRFLLRLFKRSTKPSLYLTIEGVKSLV